MSLSDFSYSLHHSSFILGFASHEPVRESFPAKTDGSIHAHQEEERPQQKPVEGQAICNVGGHPLLLPSLGHKIQQGLRGIKYEVGLDISLFSVSVRPDFRGLESEVVIGLIGDTLGRFSGQLEQLKPFVLDQIFSNCMFAGANGYRATS